jgi:exoribonuclease R
VEGPGDTGKGHFSLAVQNYTHSTAPNRRFTDLVTQRLLRALHAGQAMPYEREQLEVIARHCTEREDAARKVERIMGKRLAALAFQHRIGEQFDAIVTGVKSNGVYVRVLHPPVEGRLMQGEQGVDVGDQIHVRLLHADPERGFIDFVR